MFDALLDRFIGSEATKRYISGAVRRYGAAAGVWLMTRYGAKYGLGPEALTHWNGLMEAVAPAVALALIEIWSAVRARMTAKTVEVAIQAPSTKNVAEVKAIAKAELKAGLRP